MEDIEEFDGQDSVMEFDVDKSRVEGGNNKPYDEASDNKNNVSTNDKDNNEAATDDSELEEGGSNSTAVKLKVRNDLTRSLELSRESQSKSDNAASGQNNNKHQSDDEIDFDEIPLDKENPGRCVDCGDEFPNHFAVKLHYQSVHLNLSHKCTVEGCNAAFPSKRSRDRHAANLALHRKLLSTTADNDDIEMAAGGNGGLRNGDNNKPRLPPHFPGGTAAAPGGPMPPFSPYQNEFFARFLAEQQQQQQQQPRFPFPFGIPGLTPNSAAGLPPPSSPRFPPPFGGMLPFAANPLLGGDMSSRLPNLFGAAAAGKGGSPLGGGGFSSERGIDQAKLMEENLRKYMAMASMAKIENH